jgi:hypothetical protein
MPTPHAHAESRSARWYDAAGVSCFLLVLTLAGMRLAHLMLIPGEPQRSHALGKMGLADFQDVVYYPLRAVRDGVNPYDASGEPYADGTPRYRQRYPVLNLFPLYSPLLFLLYWPLGWFDFTTAAALYVAINGVLLVVWAYWCCRWSGVQPRVGSLFFLAALMLATQAGRANFLGGETSLPLAFASAAAAMSPTAMRGGVWLMIASFKPTFGLPLGILLLAASRIRTVLLGWGGGFLVGMAGLLLIFSWRGEVAKMPHILRENQAIAAQDPDWNAASSAKRVDTAGAFERWLSPWGPPWTSLGNVFALGTAALALAAQTLAARKEPGELAGGHNQLFVGCVVSVGTVAGIYHLPYDALLLWFPIVALTVAPEALWPGASLRWRWLLAGLLMVPMVNVLGTESVIRGVHQMWPALATVSPGIRELAWTCICTINGLALLLALLLFAHHAWSPRPRSA